MACIDENKKRITNQEDKHMMTKQALLENVLDMWLTQKQIEAIER